MYLYIYLYAAKDIKYRNSCWTYRVINSGSTMQICERVVSEPSDFCTSEPKVSNSVWTKAGGTGRHPSRLSFDALIRSCCDGFQENDSGWQESFELPLEFAPYFFDLDVGTVYEWDGMIAVYDFRDFCQPMARFWPVLMEMLKTYINRILQGFGFDLCFLLEAGTSQSELWELPDLWSWDDWWMFLFAFRITFHFIIKVLMLC